MSASEGNAVRKELLKRGYEVRRPTGRGRSSWEVYDPTTGVLIARFPTHPSRGSWRANLDAGIRRYERTGVAPRSAKVPSR